MLRIDWTTEAPPAGPTRARIVPLSARFAIDAIEARFGRAVRKTLESAPFRGKAGEKFALHREVGGELEPLCFLGVGDDLARAEDVRRIAHDATRHIEGLGVHELLLDLQHDDLGFHARGAELGSLIVQGLELGTYTYSRFLSDPKPHPLEAAVIWCNDAAAVEGTARGRIIAQAIAEARDLGNGPAELVTPSYLASTAESIFESLRGEHDVTVTVLDREACKARKMGCFLGVAKGSGEPPKFIHLHYEAAGTPIGKIALVGKGVTFDSGGYSLKPSDGMLDMKLDMCGAAAVLASFRALVQLRVPWNVDVIVAATENMIGPHAYRLGDVLTASNGKTVEINNTDAEGRLTLADALVYAAGLEPNLMIDFATLTGACIVALGPRIAGVMTDDDVLAREWLAASERSGESMWRLPLPKDLKEQLKSKVADMRNTGERYGGALTGALFLSEFTEGRRWMHVDIAGPAMVTKPYGVNAAGASGFPVATILELLTSSTGLAD